MAFSGGCQNHFHGFSAGGGGVLIWHGPDTLGEITGPFLANLGIIPKLLCSGPRFVP
ncbi:MAG: hypothetical protein ACK5E4_15660 [Planctomycetia bacterium]